MKKICLVACCLFIYMQVSAQTWVGTNSSDWNTASNWSPASVPTSSSNVTFNAASPPHDCILTSVVTVSQFTQSAGTFTINAGGSLTVTNPFTVSGGAFHAGSGIVSVPNNTYTLSGGTFFGETATINLGATVQINNPMFFNAGTSTVAFNGTNSQSINIIFPSSPHILVLNKMILNKPGTTLQFNGSTADIIEVQNSMILIDGQIQGTSNFQADNNVWVQKAFDGSAIPITFAGSTNSMVRLDTTFVNLSGNVSVTINKASPSNTVSFITGNPTDTIRSGNNNADLFITTGILQFPDNPPVQFHFKTINIQTGGTLSAPTNFFYNAGSHINTGGTFLPNNGTYVFYQPSIPATTQFTTHNENFNNLILDLAGSPSGQFNPSANDTLIVNGDLTLKGGLITGGSKSAFNLKGNFIFGLSMDPTQTFTKLVFTGDANQNVNFAPGSEANWNSSVTINKPSGLVILNSPWTLDESNQVFTFTKGIVSIPDTANNYLFFTNNYAVTGASAVSYVDGPVRVKRWENSPFEFPIGNAGFYAPILISDFWNSSEDWILSAQYFHKPSQFATSSSKDPGLTNISQKEWWPIKLVSGTINAGSNAPFLWLSYDNVRSGGVTDATKLRITKWDASVNRWVDRGNALDPTVGFIKSVQPVSTFSPFTLASTDAVANPLPLHLIKFTVTPEASDNLLQWTSANEENFDKYIVERSRDGMNFNDLGSVKAVNNDLENSYQYKDASVDPKAFYRLRMIDIDGKYQYSPVVSIDRAINTFTCRVMPNPGNGNFTVNMSSPENITGVIRISDANGKIVWQQNISISKGNNAYPYQLSSLQSGLYFINITTSKGDHESIRYMVMKN